MQYFLEVGNLVFKVGGKELLEVFEDWFLPLIKNARLPGRGETLEYVFLNVELVAVGKNNEPILIGRLVKDLSIRAQQVFSDDANSVIPSEQTMKSAPSAFFALILNTHKLLWVKETYRAPDLHDFEMCLTQLMRKKRKEYLDQQIDTLKKQTLAASKRKRFDHESEEYKEYRQVIAEFYKDSLPEIHVTPLADKSTIDQSIEQFEKVKTLKLTFKAVNSETGKDNYQFLFKGNRQAKNKLGARTERVEFVNNQDGLDKRESAELMKAAGDGNFDIVASGIGKDGAKMTTDLKEVSVKAPLGFDAAWALVDKVAAAWKKYSKLIDTKTIYVQEPTLESIEAANSILHDFDDL